MKNRDLRLIDSVSRAEMFASQQAAKSPRLRPLAKRLVAHRQRLSDLRDQEFATFKAQGHEGLGIRRLREDLRLVHLIPIARAGKKLLRFAPGTERAFTVPGKRATGEAVVAASRVMMKAAKPSAKLFVEVGFGRDFVAQCAKLTDELSRRAAEWDAGRKRRAKVTGDLAAELRAARSVIDVFDAFLLAEIRHDRTMRVLWTSAKKVGPRMGRPKKKRVPPVTP